jgi:hypothetical protein
MRHLDVRHGIDHIHLTVLDIARDRLQCGGYNRLLRDFPKAAAGAISLFVAIFESVPSS